MNKLLAKVSEFTAWAGMELCVHKCEVAAYDFGMQTELYTCKVCYNWQRLAHLLADAAVRFLWLSLTVTGDTSAEVTYIISSMKTAATKFKSHPYSYRQGFNLIPTALHLVFKYSVGVTSWTMAEMQTLHIMWGLMGKRTWDLPVTEGHNTPWEEGGISQPSPFHLAAKSTLQLLKQATGGLQTDILTLVQDEWSHLCTVWGSSSPQEVQAALLLPSYLTHRTWAARCFPRHCTTWVTLACYWPGRSCLA